MRRVIQTAEAGLIGTRRQALHDIAEVGLATHIGYGVFLEGGQKPTNLEASHALAVATSGGISGSAAGEFYDLDSITASRVDFTVPPGHSNARPGARRRKVELVTVNGIATVTGTQTMVDLAAEVDDLVWEQALESALFKTLTTIEQMEAALVAMSRSRTPGTARVRRVLALRPPGAPPTESLLETLAVQMCRKHGLPTPTRQYKVWGHFGRHDRIDLCWPEVNVFLELDGQGHKGQPVYDASRQTRVAAKTGWLCGRYSWRQIKYNATPSARELRRLLEQGAAIRR